MVCGSTGRWADSAGRDELLTLDCKIEWADGGYAGKLLAWIQHHCRIVLEIVRKPEGQRTSAVLPRRWVVERTLSWLVRCRRLGRDYERLPEHAEAMVKWSMIGLMADAWHPPPGDAPGSRLMPDDPFPNTYLA